jgi:hypothetical protein
MHGPVRSEALEDGLGKQVCGTVPNEAKLWVFLLQHDRSPDGPIHAPESKKPRLVDLGFVVSVTPLR